MAFKGFRIMSQASVIMRALTFLGRVAGGVVFLVALIVLAKLSGWSPLNLVFGPQYEPSRSAPQDPPPDGRVFTAFKEKAWWLTEYGQLNATLDRAGGKLSASYRTGPEGQGIVNIQLIRAPNRGLILFVDAPPQSVKSLDEQTGQLVPQTHRNVFTFRDVNLDGIPDHVRMEPAGAPISQEAFTDDGFMRVRDSVDHTAVLVQWSIGIGYCTNHFLHDKESAFP
jgi:hypothetical protein